MNSICLLGFGEVGQTLAADLSALPGIHLTAFDILFADDSSVPSIAINKIPALTKSATAAAGASQSDLIISAVTAAQAPAAARSVADCMSADTYFLDLNSVSPATSIETAAIIEAGGGRFVEAAVMSPIEPKRSGSPILLGGSHAQTFLEAASALGFEDSTAFSDQIGPASATKMCRSVIIKGLEALLVESLLAARFYGVEKDVIGSLHNLLQDDNWQAKARYMIARSIKHGLRRAEEMREAAGAVRGAGVEPLMSTACVNRQQWASEFNNALPHGDLSGMLEQMLLNEDLFLEKKTA